MSRARGVLYGLLAATLLAGSATAQDSIRPRGAPAPPPLTPEEKAAQRVQKAEDMAAWLPRLVGRFTIEGVLQASGQGDPTSATGKMDCIAVGTGAGVQCVIFATWEEVFANEPGATLTAGIPFLGPASILYGVDPNAVGVRFMQLDTDGLVNDGLAQLNGNTLYLVYEGYCPSEPQAQCRQETRIYAPPHQRYIHTTIEIAPLMGDSGGAESATLDLEITPLYLGQPDVMPATPAASATNPG